VAGVVDELLLARGGPLLGVEHGVQRPAQAGKRVGHVQADARGARCDLRHLQAVALDRVQRQVGQAAPHERRQRERQQVAARHLGQQLAHRLVALVQ
jgi:hypothetical protein